MSSNPWPDPSREGTVRVVIVEDSASTRLTYRRLLADEPGLEIVGEAGDPYEARPLIVDLQPDVVLLDAIMPRMDGREFLDKLMQYYPLPVVLATSLAIESREIALDALERGAVEVLAKPRNRNELDEFGIQLRRALLGASLARVAAVEPASVGAAPILAPVTPASDDAVVVIGASTGGTTAIEQIVSRMPAQGPPIVLVQHLPPDFTSLFAARLDTTCAMEVREAAEGDEVRAGRILVAAGGRDLRLTEEGGRLVCRLSRGAGTKGEEDGHRLFCPSVDVLFESAAGLAEREAVGVLLTGMGDDGAKGLKALRGAGAWTLAQDESTCVVFGMPKSAIELGAAREVLSLPAIAPRILELTARTRQSPRL